LPRPSQDAFQPAYLKPATSSPDGGSVAIKPLGDVLYSITGCNTQENACPLHAVKRLGAATGDRL
jgi:hypothetical protein